MDGRDAGRASPHDMRGTRGKSREPSSTCHAVTHILVVVLATFWECLKRWLGAPTGIVHIFQLIVLRSDTKLSCRIFPTFSPRTLADCVQWTGKRDGRRMDLGYCRAPLRG